MGLNFLSRRGSTVIPRMQELIPTTLSYCHQIFQLPKILKAFVLSHVTRIEIINTEQNFKINSRPSMT